MLTAHTVKLIKSLDKKKFRQKYKLFVAEGNKIIRELAQSRFVIQDLYTVTPDFFQDSSFSVNAITENELKKISFLQHPKDSIAICKIPDENKSDQSDITLILDGIQDPGNMGTIIRLADWFGIEKIVCSEDTADYLNPKVVQASMGSFARVGIKYADLQSYLKGSECLSFGTDMIGENLYQKTFPEKFNLVLGNEGNGMRETTANLVDSMISIPRFGITQSTESLNVSIAAGIILGQIFAQK